MRRKWLYLLLFCLLPFCHAQEEEIQKLLQLITDKDQDHDSRWHAVYKLGQLREKAAPAVSTLIKLLLDENEVVFVRTATVETLGKIGEEAAPVVPILIKLLLREDDFKNPFCFPPYNFIAIVTALGNIGEKAALAAPALRTFVQIAKPSRYISEDKIISETAYALGRIGEKALPTVFAMLEDSDVRVVVCGLNALEHISASKKTSTQKQIEPVVPLIAKIFTEKQRSDKPFECGTFFRDYSAAIILEQIGPKSVPALLGVLEKEGLKIGGGYAWLQKIQETGGTVEEIRGKVDLKEQRRYQQPLMYATDVLLQMGEAILPDLEQALEDKKYAKIQPEIKKIIEWIKTKPVISPSMEKKRKVHVHLSRPNTPDLIYIFENTAMSHIIEMLLKEGVDRELATDALKQFGTESIPHLQAALADPKFSEIHSVLKDIIAEIQKNEAGQKQKTEEQQK